MREKLNLLQRSHWIAIVAVVACIAVAGAAYGLTAGSDLAASTPSTTTTDVTPDTATTLASPATTTPPTTTTTADVTSTTTAPVQGLVAGAESEAVAALQRRLSELRYDPGPADGVFGAGTTYAVQAFQKLQGMEPTGKVTAEVEAALASATTPEALIPNGGANRVEIDLRRQVLFVYQGNDLRLISHISSGNGKRYCAPGGCGTAITPVGAHRFMWRYSGWRTSRLGKLYNPVYFTGSGIAIHGSNSVPTYPASHGCVRIPMHIAEYFPDLVAKGDAVYVLDGKTSVGPAAPLPSELPPPPPDPVTSPDTTTETTVAPPTTTAPPPVMTLPTTTTAPAPITTPTTSGTTSPSTIAPVNRVP